METWIGAAERILLFCRQNGRRSIALVSIHSGSGTTTCSHALAGLAAQSGFHPIMIDLSQPATSAKTGQDIVRIPASLNSENITDPQSYDTIRINLVENDKFSFNNPNWFNERIDQILGNFDFAVIDLPAIIDRDTLAINPLPVLSQCDCVLLICEPGRVKRASLLAALEQVRLAGAHIDGIIYNQPNADDLGEQLVSVVRRLSGIAPPLAKWLERKIRNTELFP